MTDQPIDLDAIKREHAADINFARRGAHALGIRKMDDPPAWEHREKLIAEVERLRGALAEIARVTAPLESLEINHRYAVECARAALGAP